MTPKRRYGARAEPGECGQRYFHLTADALLECCRTAGHPGCHEGYTGNDRLERDCEWRWWDDEEAEPGINRWDPSRC